METPLDVLSMAATLIHDQLNKANNKNKGKWHTFLSTHYGMYTIRPPHLLQRLDCRLEMPAPARPPERASAFEPRRKLAADRVT